MLARHKDRGWSNLCKTTGFSITELMVACALTGLLITTITTYSAQSHVSLSLLQHATTIEEDMRALQDTISRHLGRAGFVKNSSLLTPFLTLANSTNAAVNVTLSQQSDEPPNSCITFSYDKNHSGLISMAQGELLGYRLNDKSIEYRVGGKTCEQGGWYDLTDPKTIEVTQFVVSMLRKSSWGSAYEIRISAKSAVNPSIVTSKTFVVEVVNGG